MSVVENGSYQPARIRSALPQSSDIRGAGWYVAFVPLATNAPQQITSLFDHLVGTGEQRRGHIDPKRLGGLHVDHHFVLGRRLHREVGWLLALEDAINVAGRAPERIYCIRSIGDQAAANGVVAVGVDRGPALRDRQRPRS
jgi:hypothetical protein